MRTSKLDKQIEQLYYRNCSGIQINIMDISKVFKAGRTAAANGTDIEQAIIACVAELAYNNQSDEYKRLVARLRAA